MRDRLGGGQARHAIFVTLDGMRGIAALVVVLWHAVALSGFRPLSGYLAVDLFFVLSGFVIAHSYDLRLEHGMTWYQFIRVRIIRLYPLYFLGTLIAVCGLLASAMFGAKTNWNLERILVSFGFSAFGFPTPDPMSNNHMLFPLNPPAWSLLFEIIVNVAYVSFFRYLNYRVLSIVAIVSAILLAFSTENYGSLNTGFFWFTMPAALPRVFFSFTMGVILLRLFRAGKISLRMGSTLPLLLMLAVLCYGPVDGWRPIYDMVATFVVFPMLTLAGASSQPARGVKIFESVGLASYAVYVLHVPLLAIGISGISKILHGNPAMFRPWGGIVFALVVLAIAWLAAIFYDAPIRRRLVAWPNLRVRESKRLP